MEMRKLSVRSHCNSAEQSHTQEFTVRYHAKTARVPATRAGDEKSAGLWFEVLHNRRIDIEITCTDHPDMGAGHFPVHRGIELPERDIAVCLESTGNAKRELV